MLMKSLGVSSTYGVDRRKGLIDLLFALLIGNIEIVGDWKML